MAEAVERIESPRASRQDPVMVLIQATLDECAATFGTQRARFLRHLANGTWQVYAIQQGKLTTHAADYAEASMAWAVALSRFPVRASRPRVSSPDGSNVRPIAVTTYFGIPVLCGDQIAGVIELGGQIDGDPGDHGEAMAERLAIFGTRLLHDPGLRTRGEQTEPACECRIAGGNWFSGQVELSDDEWTFLVALNGTESLTAIAERAGMDIAAAGVVAASLAARGIVELVEPANPVGS